MLRRIQQTEGPLAGVEILEITGRPAGAYCGRLLTLLGATVVRAEVPLVADCPAHLAADLAEILHEGKRTIPTRERGALRDAMRRCALVVVDSRDDDASDGALVELTRALLDERPPATPLVDLAGLRSSLSEGDTEPCAPIIATAASGMSWGIGAPDHPPLTLPYDLPDYHAGAEAAAASAMALLLAGTPGGASLRWDLTTTDVLSYYIGQIGANFLPYERPWRRDGARATMSGGSYPGAMFPCRDGSVSIMCRTSREYQRLVAALGDPAWSKRPGFDDSRVVARFHADEVDRHVIAWTSARTREEVFAAGQEYGFPVAPVSTLAEALAQEQFAHRDFLAVDRRGRRRAGSPYHLYESVTERPARPFGWPGEAVGAEAPLAGLRVLDLSWVWSGPMVTAALRDLGAEVLKIEHRERADPARLRGRALRGGVPVEGPELEVTPYFNQMNHGKRSVAIDMGQPEGAALIAQLAAKSDVVVENMRPGVLHRRGLDYQSLTADNPGLVMLSLSMLGQTGPLSGLRGYAPVMTGLAGLDSLVGYRTGHLIGTYNPALGDPNGADHGLAALLAALVRRQRTGRGCYVDLSQVEALLSVLPGPILQLETDGVVAVPGNGHHRFAPQLTLPCRDEDSWVSVAARTASERAALADLLGLDATVDPGEMGEPLARWARELAAEHAAEALHRLGVPASVVLGYPGAVFGPRARARGVGTPTEHPWLGEQTIATLPWKVAGRAFAAAGPAPILGADTDSVLRELLGLGSAELDALRDRRVIECAG